MIKTKKKCSISGCDWPLYARGYCLSHYRSLYLASKAKPKRLRKKIISKISSNQLKRISIYEKKKTEKRTMLIKQGKWYCIFTGKPFPLKGPMPGFHHLIGRDGNNMTDIEFIWPAYNEPHRQYHDLDYEKIIKLPWYEGFLNRLNEINEICHNKEMRKKEKYENQP